MKVVLDTNVLVSGLLKPSGPCGMVVQLAVTNRFQICFDARMLLEYHRVLARPKFGFDPQDTSHLLVVIETKGMVGTALPLRKRLPDRTDEVFLEVALGSKADYLVTGNKRDFPRGAGGPVRIVSPSEFLDVLRS